MTSYAPCIQHALYYNAFVYACRKDRYNDMNKLRFPDVLIFSLVSLPISQSVFSIGVDLVQHQGFPALYGFIGVILGLPIYLIIYGCMCSYTAFPIMLTFWLIRIFLGARPLAFFIATTSTSALLVYGPFAAQSNLHEIHFSLPACILAIMVHEIIFLRQFLQKQKG